MPNTVLLDFSKGMYGEVSPTLLGKGFALFLANANMDGGVARAVKAPKLDGTITPGAGAVQSFSHRGTWYHSTVLRDYAAHRVGIQDRVFYTLAAGGGAKKVINGTTADLGTPRPRKRLGVVVNAPPVPIGFRIEAYTTIPKGTLTGGAGYWYSYSIAYTFNGVAGPATAVATLQLTDTGSIRLSWNAMAAGVGADGIVIYGRIMGQRGTLVRLPVTETQWIDDGKVSASGSPIEKAERPESKTTTKPTGKDGGTSTKESGRRNDESQFQDNPYSDSRYLDGLTYTYLWTVTRNVNGHLDESGPSAVSLPVDGYLPRTITRPAGGAGVLRFTSEIQASVSPIALSFTASTIHRDISGIYNPPGANHTLITIESTQAAHGYSTGQNLALVGYVPKVLDMIGAEVVSDPYISGMVDVTVPASLTMSAVGVSLGISVASGRTLQTALTRYAVAAINGAWPGASGADGTGAFTGSGRPAETTIQYVAPGATGNYKPTISWTPVDGATGYAIYFSNNNGTSYGLLARVSASTVFWLDDNTITPNASIAPLSVNTTGSYVLKVPLDAIVPPNKYQERRPIDLLFGEAPPAPVATYGPRLGSTIINPTTTVTLPTGHGVTNGQVVNFVTDGIPDADKTFYPGDYTVSSAGATSVVIDMPMAAARTPDKHLPLKMRVGSVDTSNIISWNIYRAGGGDDWGLVASLPIATATFVDAVEKLGTSLPTYYQDNGVDVIFDAPPTDLQKPVLHNMMLVGISGNFIRWTPVNRPDAWPAAFAVAMPSKPIALSSFAGSLFIFTLDGVWRMDFTSPTIFNLYKTLDEDGCIAPNTIQQLSNRLVFLSSTGLRAFLGAANQSVPITLRRLDSRFFLSPSVPTTAFAHWWTPGQKSGPYAYLTRRLGTPTRAGLTAQLDTPVSFTDSTTELRSFVWDGKYFLYWQGANYTHGGVLEVDLDRDTPSFVWHDIRPIWVHTDEYGRAWMLLGATTASLAAAQALSAAEPDDDTGVTGTLNNASPSMYEWGRKDGPAGKLTLRTGPVYFGGPHVRLRYRKMEVHGTGTFSVTAYVDGVRVPAGTAWASVQATETPTHARRMNFPIGTKGYGIDLLITGDGEVTGVEFEVDGMPSES